MRFAAREVACAKTLRGLGFPWRPKVGDWYVSHHGFCGVVLDFDQAQVVGTNGHAFLPTWRDCREWLAMRGWRHPEVVIDEPEHVMMTVTHDDGKMLRTVGVSDLECIYRLILEVLLNPPHN